MKKLLFRLCRWILKYEHNPPFVKIETERIQHFQVEKIFSKYSLVQFGEGFIESSMKEELIKYLCRRSDFISVKRETALELYDFTRDRVLYKASVDIIMTKKD